MRKPAKKKAGTRPIRSAIEIEARQNAENLRRLVVQQKRVRALSRAVMAATAAADRELRYVLRMAAQRLEPGKSVVGNDNAGNE